MTTDTIDDPLLDRNDILKRWPHLPVSRTNLHRLMAKGFPEAIKLSARRRVWRQSAVAAFVEKCERESDSAMKKGPKKPKPAKG